MPPNYVEPTLSSGINGSCKAESVASQQSQAVAQIRLEYNELKSKASIHPIPSFFSLVTKVSIPLFSPPGCCVVLMLFH